MKELILIVDDSLTVRMDLQEAFDEAGLACSACADLASARRFLAAHQPALVVLDVQLPDGSGVELLRELRERPGGRDIVVLMLSGEAEVKDRLRGLQMGADEYVGKPYDRGYVTARARELLRTHHRGRPRQATPTVLLIDDSASFREAMRDHLERAGYQVLLAASGEDGLLIAGAARPDALLVDQQLPGIDGAAVIRRVRLDAALRDTPCLLLTASDEPGAELRALDAGADAFVRKTQDEALVLARLSAMLRGGPLAIGPAAGGELGPKKILAVDDSPAYLDTLGTLLRGEGYDVIPARSGEHALELLAVQAVDIILMDLQMPGMSGREACERIRAVPLLCEIPLLMLSEHEEREVMLEALEAGADDFIPKSADFEVLKARVRAQLRRKQSEDINRRARLQWLNMEMEAAEARAANQLAASRAELLAELARKNEALEQANLELARVNQAKTDFMSTMSHELRTPLNAIIGFSEILKEGLTGPLQPRQAEFCRHIHDSGRHLLDLINDLLDLAKIEAGKVEIEREHVLVNALLDDATLLVRDRAAARGVLLDVAHAGAAEALQADRRRAKQILLNLLTNAVKFSPAGGSVRLSARQVDRQRATHAIPGNDVHGMRTPLPEGIEDCFIEFNIADQGLGLSPEDLDQLFKPFAQIRNEATRQLEGTGLGLVTVAGLVELHGGALAVSSEPGKGSCFSFWLPCGGDGTPEATTKPEAAMQAAAASPSRADAPVSPWALVVEDDAAGAELIRAQLEAEGFRVRLAPSAEDALALAPGFRPDLITLDIHLPGMDGWEFLCRLQELPAWAEVPVVVVSLDADHEVGASLGAAAVMQKPIRRDDLHRELGSLGLRPTEARQFKVLVIDDGGNHEALNAELGQPGYSFLHASGGRQGIQLTQHHLPDLVILELLMRDMGGLEVVEALKADSRTANIPVIMLAAKQFSEDDRRRLNAYAETVVARTRYRPERFRAEVKRAFGPSSRLQ
ncbi:response regulator [Pelomonas sp. KK5]|uniref:response regulator n=1 Tax=Pelomonas sp. KK5 TaxID=1855730 RepID=UPI00097BE811|nr:response regulator [Pelomonas sp. KK5]